MYVDKITDPQCGSQGIGIYEIGKPCLQHKGLISQGWNEKWIVGLTQIAVPDSIAICDKALLIRLIALQYTQITGPESPGLYVLAPRAIDLLYEK